MRRDYLVKKIRRGEKLGTFRSKNRLMIVIALLIAAPLFINLGLMFTDVIFSKMGIDLTAKGLNNAN